MRLGLAEVELVNTTALAARLDVGSPLSDGSRRGMVLAKATFRFDARGGVELETENPVPLFVQDEITPLGVLPKDDVPRTDPSFEVMLLGVAYAPSGSGVTQMEVSLTVADTTRTLSVVGDREWSRDAVPRITDPAPFEQMPLTWSRAFGGSAEVEIDEGTYIPVRYGKNPAGKGMDLAARGRELNEAYSCPEGYPRFDAVRSLPNLEDPSTSVVRWDDAPQPVCWAPVDILSEIYTNDAADLPPGQTPLAWRHHRAHPQWILDDAPAAESPVRMRGLTPGGEVVFPFPRVSPALHYVLDGRVGERPLVEHALVLLPCEERFYVVYRLPFSVPPPSRMERRAVLRIGRKR